MRYIKKYEGFRDLALGVGLGVNSLISPNSDNSTNIDTKKEWSVTSIPKYHLKVDIPKNILLSIGLDSKTIEDNLHNQPLLKFCHDLNASCMRVQFEWWW